MTEEQLRQFLKDHLRVTYEVDGEWERGIYTEWVAVKLWIDDDEISAHKWTVSRTTTTR